ncbi:MAG: hypothetical protein ACOY5Y_07125 [Pseudomonadota bacterium]
MNDEGLAIEKVRALLARDTPIEVLAQAIQLMTVAIVDLQRRVEALEGGRPAPPR